MSCTILYIDDCTNTPNLFALLAGLRGPMLDRGFFTAVKNTLSLDRPFTDLF